MNPTIKLKFKIIGFTKFPDGQDNDCEAINEKGEKFLVDPFVGCAWEYENREHLLGIWFESMGHFHEDGVFLPAENTMKVILGRPSDGKQGESRGQTSVQK